MSHSTIQPVSTTPTLVWKVSYPGDLTSAVTRATKETMLMPPNTGSMRGGGKTNANHNKVDPHMWNELHDFMVWLQPFVNQVWQEWHMQDIPLEVMNSWTNITNQNGFVTEHDHSPSHMAASIYLNKPEGSGNIEFRNPLHSSWTYMPRSHEDLSKQDFWQEVPCDTNDVLLFPAWLSHRVQENTVNENRVVMSMNIVGVKNET